MKVRAVLSLAIVAALLALWWSTRTISPQAVSSAAVPTVTPAATVSPLSSVPTPAALTPSDTEHLTALISALRGANEADARQLLTELRAYLRNLPGDRALKVIREFLDTTSDVPVPLDFTIAADGSLETAPTLRVWLLDTLTLVAPQAAADYAQRILSSSNSADEWAVSLRAYGIGRPDDIAFLKAKAGELLARSDWRAKPSTGYLEAFDILVHTHATEFIPQLATFVQDKQNRAVGHAAFLTLDRLVQQDPAKVLTQLQSQPALMTGREQTRANYFARADVRDPQQRTLLETYLLDPRRTPQELDTFAGIYPNANYMISHNLLTRTATPTGEDLAAHDREALKAVESWLVDPRFAAQQAQLEKIHTRLRQFTR
jgi:hypothetical protein